MEKVINEYDLDGYVEYLENLFNEFLENAHKNIENDNKAAGTRARRISLDLDKGLKQYRKYTLDRDKTLGRKSK